MNIKQSPEQKNNSLTGFLGKLVRARWVTFIIGGLLCLYSISGIFVFRKIPYLSDNTYAVVRWPLACILIGALSLLINLGLFYAKKSKPRKIMLILSALAVVSLIGNSIIYQLNKEDSVDPGTVAYETSAVMDGQTFMAGAAKGDITPADEMFPMPLLAVIRFDKAIDHVYARVLSVSDGTQEALFIMLDMTCVPYAEDLLPFLSEQTGLPEEKIFVAATHTHGTSPVSMMDYINPLDNVKCRDWYEDIKSTLLVTIGEARANMVPARFGYGTGESLVNVNRDVLEGETAVIGSNFDGESDKTIRMLRFEDLDGNPIALIVNYACHSVVTNGSLHYGIREAYTGDLAGRTSTKLEEQLDGAVVLWSSGAAGDQNPRIMVQYGGELEEDCAAPSNLGKAAYTILEYLSDEHVRDILKANDSIQCDQTSGSISCSEKTVTVEGINGGDQSYRLRLFIIGDFAMQGISAEVVTSVGKAVLETSPYENTMLVTLANGYEGYVINEWEFDHDAFEKDLTRAARGVAEPAFVEGFEDLFADVVP